MPMNQALLGEFDHEMATTRKTLERVPDAKWDWKPHPKSGTMGWLANHIALFPGWLAGIFASESLDFAPGGKQMEQPTRAQPARTARDFRQRHVRSPRGAGESKRSGTNGHLDAD